MRIVLVLLLAAVALFANDTFQLFGFEWTVPDSADWQVARLADPPVLRLLIGKEPASSGPRRPTQFALAETPPFSEVKVEGDVRPLGSSLIIVFAYRDPAHFDYAHLSVDTAVKEPHHNGIFHVYGGERVRISSTVGPSAFKEKSRWHHVILHHDGVTGTVNVQVDGTAVPALHAIDLSLTSGKAGIGSFDETGEFKNVKITGVRAS